MASWSEQQARDRLMDAYIDTDPLDITFHRPVKVADGAGGFVQSGNDTLASDRYMIYPFKRRLTREFRYNPQTFGEEEVKYIDWIIIFNRGQNIREADYFDPSVDTTPVTTRLQAGLYIVTFLSAREWDRGQAGLLYRG